MVPSGYRVERTNERVNVIGRRLFRFRAQALARKYPSILDSYHLRVEKVPKVAFFYEVAAYQNKLVKVKV